MNESRTEASESANKPSYSSVYRRLEKQVAVQSALNCALEESLQGLKHDVRLSIKADGGDELLELRAATEPDAQATEAQQLASSIYDRLLYENNVLWQHLREQVDENVSLRIASDDLDVLIRTQKTELHDQKALENQHQKELTELRGSELELFRTMTPDELSKRYKVSNKDAEPSSHVKNLLRQIEVRDESLAYSQEINESLQQRVQTFRHEYNRLRSRHDYLREKEIREKRERALLNKSRAERLALERQHAAEVKRRQQERAEREAKEKAEREAAEKAKQGRRKLWRARMTRVVAAAREQAVQEEAERRSRDKAEREAAKKRAREQRQKEKEEAEREQIRLAKEAERKKLKEQRLLTLKRQESMRKIAAELEQERLEKEKEEREAAEKKKQKERTKKQLRRGGSRKRLKQSASYRTPKEAKAPSPLRKTESAHPEALPRPTSAKSPRTRSARSRPDSARSRPESAVSRPDSAVSRPRSARSPLASESGTVAGGEDDAKSTEEGERETEDASKKDATARDETTTEADTLSSSRSRPKSAAPVKSSTLDDDEASNTAKPRPKSAHAGDASANNAESEGADDDNREPTSVPTEALSQDSGDMAYEDSAVPERKPASRVQSSADVKSGREGGEDAEATEGHDSGDGEAGLLSPSAAVEGDAKSDDGRASVAGSEDSLGRPPSPSPAPSMSGEPSERDDGASEQPTEDTAEPAATEADTVTEPEAHGETTVTDEQPSQDADETAATSADERAVSPRLNTNTSQATVVDAAVVEADLDVYVALYDYETTDEGYLGLTEGQEVIVLDPERQGWALAVAIGERGEFPTSLTVPLEAGDDVVKYVEAVHDHRPLQPGLIPFNEGDVLIVLRSEDADGLCVGAVIGASGLTPATYIQKLDLGASTLDDLPTVTDADATQAETGATDTAAAQEEAETGEEAQGDQGAEDESAALPVVEEEASKTVEDGSTDAATPEAAVKRQAEEEEAQEKPEEEAAAKKAEEEAEAAKKAEEEAAAAKKAEEEAAAAKQAEEEAAAKKAEEEAEATKKAEEEAAAAKQAEEEAAAKKAEEEAAAAKKAEEEAAAKKAEEEAAAKQAEEEAAAKKAEEEEAARKAEEEEVARRQAEEEEAARQKAKEEAAAAKKAEEEAAAQVQTEQEAAVESTPPTGNQTSGDGITNEHLWPTEMSVALYAYEADDDTQVSLEEGDKVLVLAGDDGNGWSDAVFLGSAGIFPTTHVSEMSQVYETVQAMYDFEDADDSNCLSLREGMQVLILAMDDGSGWSTGVEVPRRGLVPSAYLGEPGVTAPGVEDTDQAEEAAETAAVTDGGDAAVPVADAGETGEEVAPGGEVEVTWYTAMYDYEAADEGEVNLGTGLTVGVTQGDDGNGWSHGFVLTVQGNAPTSYFEAGDAPAWAAGCGYGFATAMYDYQADGEGEASISEGQSIIVLGEDEEGWTNIGVVGGFGLFPSAYAEPAG